MYSISDVVRGFRARQFRLALQPQVNLISRKITGMECLVRWHHPEAGVLGPVHFLPQIEVAGLMTPLTLEVLERGLLVRKQLRAEGFTGTLAVNVNARSLMDWTFASSLAQLAAAQEEPIEGLTLEITEDARSGDDTLSAATLDELLKLGFGLCLDDFWTGYSSLDKPHLDRFEEIKVDYKLVSRIHEDRVSLAALASIATLAKNLGWRCVAEGIETRETLALVRELGCDTGQGFYFARPIDEAEIFDWMQAHVRDGCFVEPEATTLQIANPLRVLNAEEKSELQSSKTPIWAFNLDRQRMEWANSAGVAFWMADSIEALRQRDFTHDLSNAARDRLRVLRRRLRDGGGHAEIWTVYPNDQPRSVYSIFEARCSEQGDFLVLVKGFEGFTTMPSLERHHQMADAGALPEFAVDEQLTIHWCNHAAHEQFPAEVTTFSALFCNPADASRFIRTVFRDGEAIMDLRMKTAHCRMWQRLSGRLFRDIDSGAWRVLTAHTPMCDIRGCGMSGTNLTLAKAG